MYFSHLWYDLCQLSKKLWVNYLRQTIQKLVEFNEKFHFFCIFCLLFGNNLINFNQSFDLLFDLLLIDCLKLDSPPYLIDYLIQLV